MEIGWLTFDNKDLGVLDSSGIGAGQQAYLGGSKGGYAGLPVQFCQWASRHGWWFQGWACRHGWVSQWVVNMHDDRLTCVVWVSQQVGNMHNGGPTWVILRVGNMWDSKPTCAVLRVGMQAYLCGSGQSMSRQHAQWWAYLGSSEGSQQAGNMHDGGPTWVVLRVGNMQDGGLTCVVQAYLCGSVNVQNDRSTCVDVGVYGTVWWYMGESGERLKRGVGSGRE
ncbi:hypothetical protein F5141DRAFT_1060137 [Pisolithus sp. B1]|nr:hypothetical protein F5141DRAFT_1060137 [Pisolithus sp. B1]